MARQLRVLMIEDSPDDAELILLELKRGGFVITSRRVEDGASLDAALCEQTWDIVLADYALPTLTGMEALEIARRRDPDVPVIIVSGAIGEDVAVEAMRRGARDYVLKHNLSRLPPAVERELREARSRRDQHRDEEAQRLLSQVTARLVSVFDSRAALESVVRELVPQFTTSALVDLVVGAYPLELETVALAHADPGREQDLRAIVAEMPADPESRHGIWKVIREGRSEIHPELDVEDWQGAPLGIDYPPLLRALDVRSYMCVPMQARGRVLGAITLTSSDPSRRFGLGELRVAEELARRTAYVVDNAALYARAQEAIRLRDDFLSIASHELKTPITALQLQLQNLRQHAEQRDDRDLVRRTERALRQIQRLVVLVSNLLDVTRLAGGVMLLNCEYLDLGELVREVLDRMSDDFERTHSTVEVRVPPKLVGYWDRLRLDQVITNVLSNALKFGAGGPVTVEAEAHQRWIELRVADRGIGLAAHDTERIFGRFERAASSRAYGGLGLGLYIARQIIEAHHGTIQARAREGGGALFTIRLPPAPAAERTTS